MSLGVPIGGGQLGATPSPGWESVVAWASPRGQRIGWAEPWKAGVTKPVCPLASSEITGFQNISAGAGLPVS